ncbi:MAG TPA: ATPase, T2SS/T4P/T4SS family [Candidatus Saccharimonadales bacterium]|nr:ATPase, T2SS/T4P/T4SS family [Candidatus Saccharimonadales bacterium]
MAVTNDVVKNISKKAGLPTFKTRAYLKALTDVIGEGLQEGDKIELEGLGVFKLLRLPSRKVETKLGGKKRVINLAASTTPDFEVAEKLKTQVEPDAEKNEPAKGEDPEQFRTSKIDNIGFIELNSKTIPKNILALIPEQIARRYNAVPFQLTDKTLSVGMTDPENEEAFNIIRKTSGKIIKPFLTTQEDINFILDQYSALQSELKELVEDSEEEGEISTVEEKEEKVSEDEITETSPAAKIVSTLLKRAVRERASDIHIEPSEEEVTVRFRLDGVLKKVLSLPKEVQPAVISRIKILSNLKIDETRLPQDGRIQILLDGNKIDFRVSIIPTVTGEKIVARVLDHSRGVMNFDQLGLRGRQLKVLQEHTKKSHGMTLVTGPTGSGKSTTLYAIISQIKDESINIITMEDPVEYRMPGVNQSQVNTRIGYTFATGLRSILRQDPNVVMVGEIRDRETADIAINAALTGHIVLSSLHTNDAAGALPRLLDMGIEPFLITSSVNAIIAQRLCRNTCEKCRREIEIPSEVLTEVQQELDTLPEPERSEYKKKNKFFAGSGCGACGNTGFKGRAGIYEIMPVSKDIKVLVLKSASGAEISAQAKKEGLISMRQDGFMKCLDGVTTIEEVWRVTRD